MCAECNGRIEWICDECAKHKGASLAVEENWYNWDLCAFCKQMKSVSHIRKWKNLLLPHEGVVEAKPLEMFRYERRDY